jgi:hypothetical protein
MALSHGLDWVPSLPAADHARSWIWPCLGLAALVGTHATVMEPSDAGCSLAAVSSDTVVCLGDGAVLDPATSLIWRTPAPGANCADIYPISPWRMPTDAEFSTIRRGSIPDSATGHEAPCVNDTLAHLRP